MKARQVPPSVEDSIGDAIKQAILDFIKTLSDPVTITNEDITIPTNDYVSGEIDIHSLSVTGLSNLEITTMKVDILSQKLTGEIKLSKIEVAGTGHPQIIIKTTNQNYDQEVSVDVTLTTLDATFSGQYDVLAGHIKNLSIKPTLGNASFKLSGIYTDDAETQKLEDELNANFAKELNADKTVFPEICTAIEEIVNDYLDANKKSE